MTVTPKSLDTAVIARAAGSGRFLTEIEVRGVALLADEPETVGGLGAGPTPYELLSGALAACTSMTIKIYAERKRLALPPFRVEVAHCIVPVEGGGSRDRFDRLISFDVPLADDLRAKVLDIAEKCPVHRTLTRGADVTTGFGPPTAHPQGEPPSEHKAEMERVCGG
ncbi:MAG: OsmC family protein [Allosphingosinicella sp.]